MSEIFISYAKEDRERARVLAAALEATGWSVFWDRTIPPGLTWRNYIGKALREARCVVVAWSRASIVSDWVLEEADVAKRQGVLIPVFFEAVEPPLGFGALQAMDLSEWDDDPQAPALAALVVAMERFLGPAPGAGATGAPAGLPVAPRRSPVGRLLGSGPRIAAALAGFGLLALIGWWVASRDSAPPPAVDSPEIEIPRTTTEPPPEPSGAEPGELEPVPEPVPEALASKLTIRSNVSRDEVFLDGAALGPTPARVEVGPGRHLIEVRRAGCQTESEWVEITTAGVDLERRFELDCSQIAERPDTPRDLPAREPDAPPPAGPPGALPCVTDVLNRCILIDGGSFLMGSPRDDDRANDDERPQHSVRVSSFYIQQHEVTNEEYRRYKPSHEYESGRDKYPVARLNWYDAEAYAEWLGGSLPTEAQWEYAARAGTATPWSFGDAESRLADYAWYSVNAGSAIHPVGQKRANYWGLYDMYGNVWEWCLDLYGKYSKRDQVDPTGPTSGNDRVVRGASFYEEARYVRSASRFHLDPEFRGSGLGFRVVWPAAD